MRPTSSPRLALGLVFAAAFSATPASAAPQSRVPPAARKAIPSPRDCEDAEIEIDKLLDAAGTKRDPAASAALCADHATKATRGSAVHFCLLTRARDYATQAGALRVALAAIAAELDTYGIDRFATLADRLEALRPPRSVRPEADELRAVTQAAVDGSLAAVSTRRLPEARRLLAVAESHTRHRDLAPYRARVKRLGADLTVIEKFDPERASAKQIGEVAEALQRCGSGRRSVDLFAEYIPGPLGDVARRDLDASRDLARIFGDRPVPSRSDSERRVMDDVWGPLFTLVADLAAAWTLVAADVGLPPPTQDGCRDRARFWQQWAIDLAPNDIERIRLSATMTDMDTEASRRRAYLAELEPKDVSPVPWCDGLQVGDTFTINGNKHPFRIAGRAHNRCLGVHAEETATTDRGVWVQFPVSSRARWLKGSVAVNDSGGTRDTHDPLEFQIWSGPELLWWSPPVQGARQVEEFVVEVGRATVLELRVVSRGSGAYGHAVWIDPCFLR